MQKDSEMHPQVVKLLGQPQYVQRTPEWHIARQNRLTASDIAAALDIPPFASYSGSPRAQLLTKKRFPEHNRFTGNEYTQWGIKHEPEAISMYEKRRNVKVLDFGLMIHPDIPWLGASPDGITADGICLEVKAPLTRQIESGVVPHHYYPQVQCQLQVLGLETAHFVQYRPSELTWPQEPILDITVVPRDDVWWAKVLPRLESFRSESQSVGHQPLQQRQRGAVKRREVACEIWDDHTDMVWHSPIPDDIQQLCSTGEAFSTLR